MGKAIAAEVAFIDTILGGGFFVSTIGIVVDTVLLTLPWAFVFHKIEDHEKYFTDKGTTESI